MVDKPEAKTDVDALIERLGQAIRETKKGYKTTEFWLSLVATIVCIAIYFVDPTSTLGKIIAGAGSVLLSLGYGTARTSQKNKVLDTLASIKNEG
jgi:hypothetical protein